MRTKKEEFIELMDLGAIEQAVDYFHRNANITRDFIGYEVYTSIKSHKYFNQFETEYYSRDFDYIDNP